MSQPPRARSRTDPPGKAALRFDIVAGLTATAVVVPQAMACATVAGLPVAVGLNTAFVPMVIHALLGSSKVLSVSSTTAQAILAGTQLGLVAPDGDLAKLITAAATLAALMGVMLVLAAVLRLGFVANFISTPVLTGFKAGIGLVIVLDQVPKLLGVHITKQNFFADVLSVAQHVPETSMMTWRWRAPPLPCSSAWSACSRIHRRRWSRWAAASLRCGSSNCRPRASRSLA